MLKKLLILAALLLPLQADAEGFTPSLSTIPNLTVSGAFTANEDSGDNDFRWESDGQTHMIFGDAGSNFVSIGSSIATQVTGTTGLQIVDGSVGLVVGADTGAKTLTNATSKFSSIGAPHYTLAEEPAAMIGMLNTGANASQINIGGSLTGYNAATRVIIYAATSGTVAGGGSQIASFDTTDITLDKPITGVTTMDSIGFTGDAAPAGDNSLKLGMVDLSGGNTILHIRTEGTGLNVAGTTTMDRSIAIKVNGTVYYFLVADSPAS